MQQNAQECVWEKTPPLSGKNPNNPRSRESTPVAVTPPSTTRDFWCKTPSATWGYRYAIGTPMQRFVCVVPAPVRARLLVCAHGHCVRARLPSRTRCLFTGTKLPMCNNNDLLSLLSRIPRAVYCNPSLIYDSITIRRPEHSRQHRWTRARSASTEQDLQPHREARPWLSPTPPSLRPP